MTGTTDIEAEFKVDLSSPDFDVIKGIEVAMTIEERGRKFYSEASRKVSAPLQPFMKFMAEQEREHYNDLFDLKASLSAMNLWANKIDPMEVAKSVAGLQAFRNVRAAKKMTGDIESLLKAMNMEKQTREFYEKFAASVKSAEGKAFFRALADWEKRHYEMVSGMYNAASYVRPET